MTILVMTSAALSLKPGVSQLQKTSRRKSTAAFSCASRTSLVLENRAYRVLRAVNLHTEALRLIKIYHGTKYDP